MTHFIEPKTKLELRDWPAELLELFDRIEQVGGEVYLVGGAVRDRVLGAWSEDYDACTSLEPAEIATLFAQELEEGTGLNFGTHHLRLGACRVELTSFRQEASYEGHRKPNSLQFGASLTQDLKRRDFTMNALLYSPRTGLVDEFGALEDLKKGQLSMIGSAEERLSEDILRALRALRFMARIPLLPDETLDKALWKTAPLLSTLSVWRVRAEFEGLLGGAWARPCLERYGRLFLKTKLFSVLKEEQWETAWKRGLETEASLRSACFLWQVQALCSEEVFRDFLRSWQQSKTEGEEIWARNSLLKYPPETRLAFHQRLSHDGVERYRRLLKEVQAIEACPERLTHFECLQSWLQASLELGLPLQAKELAVNGQDLLELGFMKGPRIRQELDLLLQAVWAGICPNQKEPLLQLARTHL